MINRPRASRVVGAAGMETKELVAIERSSVFVFVILLCVVWQDGGRRGGLRLRRVSIKSYIEY